MSVMTITYKSEDESYEVRLEYIVNRRLHYYRKNKYYPKHTQCLCFINGLLVGFGEVVKHQNDVDNQGFAYREATKKIIDKVPFEDARKYLWDRLLHYAPIENSSTNYHAIVCTEHVYGISKTTSSSSIEAIYLEQCLKCGCTKEPINIDSALYEALLINKFVKDDDGTVEMPAPIGDFIIANAEGVQTANGVYYHYADVCTLLKKFKLQEKDASTLVNALNEIISGGVINWYTKKAELALEKYNNSLKK